jgi:hypothetical protein
VVSVNPRRQLPSAWNGKRLQRGHSQGQEPVNPRLGKEVLVVQDDIPDGLEGEPHGRVCREVRVPSAEL